MHSHPVCSPQLVNELVYLLAEGEAQMLENQNASAPGRSNTRLQFTLKEKPLLNSFLNTDFFSLNQLLLIEGERAYHGDYFRKINSNDERVYLGQNIYWDWSRLRPFKAVTEVIMKTFLL